MPVLSLQDQAFPGLVQDEIVFLFAVVVVYPATPLHANRRLDGCFMPVTTAYRTIDSIYVKNPLDIEWNRFFNYRQVPTFVCESFQIQDICHFLLFELPEFIQMTMKRKIIYPAIKQTGLSFTNEKNNVTNIVNKNFFRCRRRVLRAMGITGEAGHAYFITDLEQIGERKTRARQSIPVRHRSVVLNGFVLAAVLEADFRAIPDLYFDIQLLISEPPRVASRLCFDCTPKASLFGLPVNGRKVQFAENVFYEFLDGQIAKVWSVIDKAAIASQL